MHDFSPFYIPFSSGVLFSLIPVIIALILWTLVIKGYALWVAARSGQKGWFIALLVINDLGILGLVYLIWFSPQGSNRLHRSPAVHSSPQA